MKQYLYGDKQLEEACMIMLRQAFRIPLDCETPTHLLKAGGEQRFADVADREFELVQRNTHPYQFAVYEVANQYVTC